MKSVRGFTLLEYLVALLILTLVIVMVMSLFTFQSRFGRDVSKKIMSQEDVSLAMGIIRQDVMHAGLGVSDKPELAVIVSNKTSDNTAYQELYLNYGRYLAASTLTVQPNVFLSKGYSSGLSGNTYTSPLTLAEIGGLVGDDGSVILFRPNPQGNGDGAYVYGLVSFASEDTNYAPAVTYKRVGTALIRNRTVRADGSESGTIVLGGDPFLKVTEFKVRATFFDGAITWSPNPWNPSKDFNQFLPRDLRSIEITVGYQVRTGETWAPTIEKTIRVSPRTVVLAQY